MLTDAIMDRKQVLIPNASTLGFGVRKARVGDLILFTEGDRTITGRMIGRIQYAPGVNGTVLSNMLLVLCLSNTLDHTFERWVSPKDVVYAERFNHEYTKREEVVRYFMSDDVTTAPIEDIRRAAREGWSTLEAFREDRAKREKDLAEFAHRVG